MFKLFLRGLEDDVGAFSFVMSVVLTCFGLVVSYSLGLDPDSGYVIVLAFVYFLLTITAAGFLAERDYI